MEEISELDRRILEKLVNRQQMTLKGVAKQLNITSNHLRKRIIRLKNKGLIGSWTVVINPLAFENDQLLFLFLKTNPNEPEIISEFKKHYPSSVLLSLEGIIGEYSLLATFRFSSTEDFLDSLDHLYSLIGRTVFQQYKLIEIFRIYKYKGHLIYPPNQKMSQSDEHFFNTINLVGQKKVFPPTIVELTKKLCMSRSSIYRKLKKHQSNGTILGYSIEYQTSSLEIIKAYIQIKVPLNNYESVLTFSENNPTIIDIFRTNLEYSLLLRTSHRNLIELNNFLKELYLHCKVVDTITTIVIDEVL